MSLPLNRWLGAALLTAVGAAGATPALPLPTLAEQAVRDALAPEAATSAARPAARVTPSPVAAAPVSRPVQAQAVQTRTVQARPAQTRPVQAQGVQARTVQVQRPPAPRPAPQTASTPAARAAQARAQGVQAAQAQAARTTRTGRSAIVRATAYNSLAAQTDSTPFITATGTRTRPGVVALSRDLLRSFPYGSKIMIEDLSGRYNNLLRGRVFSVEDTMAARKTNSLDIWMTTRTQALQFGARQVRITAVR